MKPILLLTILFFSAHSIAQTQRQLPAKFTTASYKIDGVLDEEGWKGAPVATDFIEWRPNAGNPESNKTEVYILYDNSNIYSVRSDFQGTAHVSADAALCPHHRHRQPPAATPAEQCGHDSLAG